MNDKMKKILEMVESGILSAEEGAKLIERTLGEHNEIKQFAENTGKIVAKATKDIVENYKQEAVFKASVDNVKGKINAATTKYVDKYNSKSKTFEIKIDEKSSFSFHGNNSKFSFSPSNNSEMMILVSYSCKDDAASEIALIKENNLYYFELNVNDFNTIDYQVTVPNKFINNLYIKSTVGKISINKSLFDDIQLDIENGTIDIISSQISKFKFNGNQGEILLKSSFFDEFRVNTNDVNLNCVENEFGIINVKSNLGRINMASDKMFYSRRMWTIDFFNGFINLILPKDKRVKSKICVESAEGTYSIKLNKRKIKKTGMINDIIQEDYFEESKAQLNLILKNTVGKIIIK